MTAVHTAGPAGRSRGGRECGDREASVRARPAWAE
jgi:hypothetical protein